MSISDISGTANKYCSQLKECLRNSAISTLEQINRKCATLVSKTIVPLSEKVAKARMSEHPDYRMLRKNYDNSTVGQKSLLERFGLTNEDGGWIKVNYSPSL